MTAHLKLSKWGNSLALRIPSHMLNDLNINQDTKLEISIANNKLILSKSQSLNELCSQISHSNLNIDKEWDDKIMGQEW